MSIKNMFVRIVKTFKHLLSLAFFRVGMVIGLLGLILLFYLKIVEPKNYVPFYPVVSQKEASLELSQIKKLFDQKKYVSITTYVNDVLGSLKDQEKSKALFFQAESYFLLKQYQSALQSFFSLYSQYPKMWQAPLRLASIHILSKNYKMVEELLSQVGVKSYEYYYWYGRYLIDIGKTKIGVNVLKSADPKSPAVNHYIGMAYQKLNKKNYARYYFIKALDKNYEYYPYVLENLFMMAVLVKDQQNLEKYEAKLSEFYGKDRNLAERVAQAYVSLGDKKKAYEVYRVFMNENNLSPRIAKVLFYLAYDLSIFPDVVRFSQSFAMDVSDQIKLAYALSQSNKPQGAVILARNLIKNSFLSKEDRFTLQKVLFENYQKLKAPAQVITIARQIVKEHHDPQIMQSLLKIYAQRYSTYRKDYIALANLLYKKEPNLLTPILEGFGSYNKDQLEFLNMVLKEDPKNMKALFYKAQNLYRAQKMDDVKATLLSLLALDESTDPLIYGKAAASLGSLLLVQKHFQDSIIWLTKADSLNPESKIKLKLALAHYSLDNQQEVIYYLTGIPKEATQSFSSEERGLYFYLVDRMPISLP